MGVRRNTFLWAALVLWTAGANAQILVVHASGVPAYAEAVEGVRAGLEKAGVSVGYVDIASQRSDQDLSSALAARTVRLVITVGADALKSVSAKPNTPPILPTMILSADASRCKPYCAGDVHLDVPVATLVRELREVLPGKARVGLIRSSASSAERDASLAKMQGPAFEVVDCDGPQQLMRAFLSLKGKVDYVICLPDGSLYNTATVRPLILASIENRLPIVGFSSSFVQAGAALGVYPDFRGVGAQTADAALRYLGGQTGFHESPRKVTVAVNQRVVRLLGLDYRQRPEMVTFK